jgi:hypothetical protein
MANCHQEFLRFNRVIRLPDTKYTELRKVRDRIRKLVKVHFARQHQGLTPAFKTQGSFVMRAAIMPSRGEYDIDDGIYLDGLGNNPGNWPAARTVLTWVHAAVAGHFPTQTHFRRACIAIINSGHWRVDLPVFALCNGKPWVADTGEGWHKSDTIELTQWFVAQFKKKHGVPLKRMVHYIKGWADQQSGQYHLPNNLVLSLYMVQEYQADTRDDRAFAATVASITRRIKQSYQLLNPLEPRELMTRRLTEKQKHEGVTAFEQLSRTAMAAVNARHRETACKLWVEQLGKMFYKVLVPTLQHGNASSHGAPAPQFSQLPRESRPGREIPRSHEHRGTEKRAIAGTRRR